MRKPAKKSSETVWLDEIEWMRGEFEGAVEVDTEGRGSNWSIENTSRGIYSKRLERRHQLQSYSVIAYLFLQTMQLIITT